MIAWLTPAAFAGLALLAGPLIAHLLARRNARRMVFPAAQFVRATQAAAVRLRRPTDLALLCVRLAVVAAAVIAAAHPLIVTRWRTAQWNARVSRAIVIDGSAADAALAGRQLAAQDSTSAFRSVVIESGDLPDALARAGNWLTSTPPSRREVVVISDFRVGALDRESLGAVAATAGIRFVRLSPPPAVRTTTLPAVSGWRESHWQPVVTVDGAGTRVTWNRNATQIAEAPAWLSVAAPPAETAAADRARHAAVSFGVPAGDDREKVLVAFAGAGSAGGEGQPVRTPWMARAAQSLRESELLAEVDVAVGVEERAGTLIVRAPIAASSAAAPAVIRAAMLSVRPAAIADRALETVTISDKDLAQWRREAAPVAADVVTGVEREADPAGESSSRWFWGFALVLVGLEAWMRRRSPRSTVQEVHADAA